VQARQAHVYALAERLAGPDRQPWRTCTAWPRCAPGWDDGLMARGQAPARLWTGWARSNEQAFVLLALAAGHARSADMALEAEALALLERVNDSPPARRLRRSAAPRRAAVRQPEHAPVRGVPAWRRRLAIRSGATLRQRRPGWRWSG